LPVVNFIKINDVDQSTRKGPKAIDRATAFSIHLMFDISEKFGCSLLCLQIFCFQVYLLYIKML